MTTEQKFKKVLFASENKLLINLYLDFESDLDKGQKGIMRMLQQQVKKLNIDDVSNQRELLIAFCEWIYKNKAGLVITDKTIDKYLKSNNMFYNG